MFPVKIKEITNLRHTDIETLAKLDEAGLLIAPQENFEQYRDRLKAMATVYNEFEQELKTDREVSVFDFVNVHEKMRIPRQIMSKAGKTDYSFYQFSIDWVPGFFLSKNVGILWGGCALSSPETMQSIFLVRSSFAENERFLWIYSRDELLAHEICHVARMPIGDPVFEEYFAYQLSTSKLRRWFGCCFQTAIDALLFIVPVFILLAARMVQVFFLENLPIWPFWLAVTVYPVFLLWRTYRIHRTVNAANSKLKNSGIKDPRPVLFRCTGEEISSLARHNSNETKQWLDTKIATELRWQVINYRFIKENQSKTRESEKTEGANL